LRRCPWPLVDLSSPAIRRRGRASGASGRVVQHEAVDLLAGPPGLGRVLHDREGQVSDQVSVVWYQSRELAALVFQVSLPTEGVVANGWAHRCLQLDRRGIIHLSESRAS
jgi:hypothetical protein